MELFGAANEEQWQIISETIDSSDYYVLIIGQRYGSIIPDGLPDAGSSYTEKEFRYAVKKGVPILAFLIDDNVDVKPRFMDTKNYDKLIEFKDLVKKDRLVEWWKRGSRGAYLGRANAPAVLRAPDAPNYVFHENRLSNMRKMQTGCEIDGNLENDAKT